MSTLGSGRTCALEVDLDPPMDGVGNSFGYANLQRAIYAELPMHGVTIRRGAPIRLQVVSPGVIRPDPDRLNVVFTMWESFEMEPFRRANLDEADVLIVPSRFCSEVFSSFGLKTLRCPLGIYPEDWPYRKRAWDGKVPFRWLWVGAPNARKGWDVLTDAWQPFAHIKDVELYLKTTGTDREEEVVHRGNVIVDNRRLEQPSLLALYHSAHGFVFPTAGEGWGLTLHEAVATGLPAVVTRYSGLLDFCDASTVTFVGHESGPARLAEAGLPTDGCPPVIAVREEVAEAMLATIKGYPKAVERARIGAQRTRGFTWERTGATLAAHLKRVAARAGL